MTTALSLYQATPLHMTAKQGDLQSVKYLVHKGADVNSKDDDGVTTVRLYNHVLMMKDQYSNLSHASKHG